MAANTLLCCTLLAIAASLAGCSRDDAQPRVAVAPAQPNAAAPAASKDPHAAQMRAIFGDDYLPAKGYAIEGGAAAELPEGALPLILAATMSMRLPSGDTALVVEGTFQRPADEELLGEVEGAPIHLYLLRQREGAWHVIRKHEHFAEQGRLATELRWVSLGAGKPGLAVETNLMNRGYLGTWLALYDPASARMTDLTGDHGLMIRSNFDGDCEERCWSAEAAWRIAPGSGQARNVPYDDLVLDITGEDIQRPGGEAEGEGEKEPQEDAGQVAENEPPAQAIALPPVEKRSLAGRARYVFSNGAYRLHEGANTLPPL